MSLDFETEDLSGLSHEQAVALLGALLLAAMKQPEIDDATIKRFQDAAAALPWVLNQHVVDELVEEARARYSGADPSQSSTFVGEIAALITDRSGGPAFFGVADPSAIKAVHCAGPSECCICCLWLFVRLFMSDGVNV